MSTNLTPDQAAKNAKVIAGKLAVLRQDMQRRMDDFTVFVEQFKGVVANYDDMTSDSDLDPRAFATVQRAERIREEVEAVTHIHTGSSDHMHYRDLMEAVFGNLAGEDLTRAW